MNIESLRLIDDAVLVRLEPPPEKQGSIHIPDNAKRVVSDQLTATVIKCGPGRRSAKNGKVTPISVAPGDKVLLYFMGAARPELKFRKDGHDHFIISEKLIQMAWTE